jgi:ribosomal protein S27E
MAKKHRKKKDKYRKTRSGGSTYLNISCAACDRPILLYQKDGPGTLYRMYLDRILAPAHLVDLQARYADKSDMPGLQCPDCGELLAVPMVYSPEGRLAFRVLKGKLHKRRGNGTFPPEK